MNSISNPFQSNVLKLNAENIQPTTSKENATNNFKKTQKTHNVNSNYTTPDDDPDFGRNCMGRKASCIQKNGLLVSLHMEKVLRRVITGGTSGTSLPRLQ